MSITLDDLGIRPVAGRVPVRHIRPADPEQHSAAVQVYDALREHEVSTGRAHEAIWRAVAEADASAAVPMSVLLACAPDEVDALGGITGYDDPPPLSESALDVLDSTVPEVVVELVRLLPVELALADPSESVRCIAAGSPHATHDQIERALADIWATVRAHAAANPSATRDQIDRGLADPEPLVRAGAVSNPNATRAQIDRGLVDDSGWVRGVAALARRA